MVIGLTFLMLAGCSNGNFDKVMDEGKTALTNKEYKMPYHHLKSTR